MAKRLSQNLNSDFIAAANRLRPKQARHKIVAYVESYDDIFFWSSLLRSLETPHYYFEVMLPSRTSLSKGKKIALMNDLGDRLGTSMIACVEKRRIPGAPAPDMVQLAIDHGRRALEEDAEC